VLVERQRQHPGAAAESRASASDFRPVLVAHRRPHDDAGVEQIEDGVALARVEASRPNSG
jgi:hypothetical protein